MRLHGATFLVEAINAHLELPDTHTDPLPPSSDRTHTSSPLKKSLQLQGSNPSLEISSS